MKIVIEENGKEIAELDYEDGQLSMNFIPEYDAYDQEAIFCTILIDVDRGITRGGIIGDGNATWRLITPMEQLSREI